MRNQTSAKVILQICIEENFESFGKFANLSVYCGSERVFCEDILLKGKDRKEVEILPDLALKSVSWKANFTIKEDRVEGKQVGKGKDYEDFVEYKVGTDKEHFITLLLDEKELFMNKVPIKFLTAQSKKTNKFS